MKQKRKETLELGNIKKLEDEIERLKSENLRLQKEIWRLREPDMVARYNR